jgi:hypothetical protein
MPCKQSFLSLKAFGSYIVTLFVCRQTADTPDRFGSSNAALSGILGIRAMSEMSKIMQVAADNDYYLVRLENTKCQRID